jgi:glycosyltransferase involved in cell wall biosynthesis
MTPNPLVSVVIPAYNAERFLAETLRSVLAQDYDPVEIVVVDDGSTDATAQIARAHGVRCLRQRNGGQAAARNAGVAAAHGELVAFLDADDICEPSRLRRQVAQLLARPELGFVLASMQRRLDPGAPPPPGTPPHWFEGPQPGTIASASLVRRSVLERVGSFQDRYRHVSDSEWHSRAADAGVQWEVMPDVLVRYRIHGANMSYDHQALKAELFDVLRSSLARKRSPAAGGESLDR